MSENITVKFNGQNIELHPSIPEGSYQSFAEYVNSPRNTKTHVEMSVVPSGREGVYDGILTNLSDSWTDGQGNRIRVIGLIGIQEAINELARAYNKRIAPMYPPPLPKDSGNNKRLIFEPRKTKANIQASNELIDQLQQKLVRSGYDSDQAGWIAVKIENVADDKDFMSVNVYDILNEYMDDNKYADRNLSLALFDLVKKSDYYQELQREGKLKWFKR